MIFLGTLGLEVSGRCLTPAILDQPTSRKWPRSRRCPSRGAFVTSWRRWRAGRFMMRSHPRSEIGIPRSFRPPQLVTAPTFSKERTALWVAQLIGPYGGPEHRDYETKISEGGCHNIITRCFGKMVPVRQDPKLGRLLRVGDRYSRLATPSMLAVGSKLRDSCGKAKAGTAVLGLAVPVAPVPKIPRPSSGCKRKAPPTPSPSLDYSPADSADPVVGELRSPLRATLDLHMKGKIGLEQVLPPSSHEVEAFTRETGLWLRSDLVVELLTGASGAGVQVFSIGREHPEEDAPTSGARAAEPGVLEGDPPTQARDGVLPSTADGARDPFVTLELVRGLVEAMGALPTLKT
ncbi:uncharacterized protein LOC112272304 [Brachypodium distachyon]|uniref:uncharacterized protein LOC112272304 n=1 Tax=Brachypodium distachyon TaxID=15368 RepID=UPI000D0DA44D|nr:uncharacterized protein LOC112272304 [Brachypodium distachyon]|eukprot:XP_024318483.1 uncharacterized protein LOC112272304 [Brachypodium distachyon]